MTVKYFAMPVRAEFWEQHRGTDALARTVHETESAPVDTGLFDVNGAKLYRVEERRPIGFIRPKG